MVYPDGKVSKVWISKENPNIGDIVYFEVVVRNDGIKGPIRSVASIEGSKILLSVYEIFESNEEKTYITDEYQINSTTEKINIYIHSTNPQDPSDEIITDSKEFTISELPSKDGSVTMSTDVELIPESVGEDVFTIRYGDRRGIKVSVTGGTPPYTYKLYKHTNHGDAELVSFLSDDNLVYLSNFEYDDKFYFVDEIKCGQETEHYLSGADLLHTYDSNNDGIIDDNEIKQMHWDYLYGNITKNELEIGNLCHNYYNGHIDDMYSLMTIEPNNPITQRYIVYVEDSTGNTTTNWFDMTIHRGKESPCPPYGSVVAPSCPSYDGSTVSFVTMLDAQMIASAVMYNISWNDLKKYVPETMTEEEFSTRLDVNNDNILNSTDIMMLAQYFKDIRDTLPVCEEECPIPSCTFTIG